MYTGSLLLIIKYSTTGNVTFSMQYYVQRYTTTNTVIMQCYITFTSDTFRQAAHIYFLFLVHCATDDDHAETIF